MLASLLVVWAAAAGLAAVVLVRSPEAFAKGLRFAFGHLRTILPIVPLAVLAAAFIAEMMPQDLASGWLGEGAGIKGILIASLIGGFIPGGPFVSFPIALAFIKAGAGLAQTVALLTAWSAIAVHRVFIWEVPVTGAGFAALRFASSLVLPPIAGVTAALLVALLGG
ncbi:MAG: hypothetical protein HY521_13595 [Proteobacteria bacterium]|nr:hypothetical protein [Pseudomonadota bacterium]